MKLLISISYEEATEVRKLKAEFLSLRTRKMESQHTVETCCKTVPPKKKNKW